MLKTLRGPERRDLGAPSKERMNANIARHLLNTSRMEAETRLREPSDSPKQSESLEAVAIE